ncbi:MAG TPA: CocE/NonD family hydrolase [Burkholderiales bacterium]|nr:CocE/NonD family hydrolase [Burkholderiales bacterium]
MTTKNVSQPKDYQLIVEKDVKIPMRDGALLYADVLRPDTGFDRVPAIMNIGPYQKDRLWIPPEDLEEKANPYLAWETGNPMYWCPRGYALVRVDARGSGKSPGASDPSSYAEAVDFYDAIEWIAKRDWCSGSIGTLGVSYHANCQWRVAKLQPPSLKAMIPWEGRADLYRDQMFHGGIYAQGFFANWVATNMAHHIIGRAREYNPGAFNNNMVWNWVTQNLDSEFWRQRSADWARTLVPFYSVGNWTGAGLHLRGNIEGFVNAASKHKKLRIHTGTHFHPFHSEEGRLDQLRFFDYWLKGQDTGIMDEPPVKLMIRTGGGNAGTYKFRFENEWPLARTRWTRLHLKAVSERQSRSGEPEGELSWDEIAEPAACTYSASPPSHAGVSSSAPSNLMGSVDRTGISFVSPPLTRDAEVTGPIVLALWVSSTSEDADLFATIRNIGPDGKDVWEEGQQGHTDYIPVAKGWLRASHRKLDPEKSLPHRPYHAHDERQWLKPGEPVECHIEIWPTSMVFKKGHRIRLDVQPRDGVGASVYRHYHADYNIGAENTIHTGGDRAGYLVLPVIPEV